ncbi:MAG: FAD-binding protein [Deltaproteobacteria bacterium]|nr:FAD-binding protein [Candidatus Zymogenaceae bacterium]
MAETYHDTDVLVMGGGGAGFRAAIEAAHSGVHVTLVSKGPLARSGASPMAGADFTLDGTSMNELGREGDVNDSKEKVFNDIVTQGWYLNNQKLVGQYVDTAKSQLADLMEWGIDITLSDQRAIFTSGTGIMDVLLKKARAVGVELLEDVSILELMKTDGRIAGALGLDVRTGEFIRFRAGAVVIASGGWHKAFWPNTGMRDLSGDGIAAAFRAGADIGNMEFITFCCNVFYAPPIWRGSLAPYILSLVCGGRMSDRNGDDLLSGFDPVLQQKGVLTEWNKSFLSYVSTLAAREGRALENGGIHYSRGDVDWGFMQMVGGVIFPNWKYKAIDFSTWAEKLEKNEPVEVGPAVEYFDGGIVVGDRFETTVPGLYAAGEAALGAFGANRVFSAVTEMLVQGRDAGRFSAEFAKAKKAPEPKRDAFREAEERACAPLSCTGGENPPAVRRNIQEAAHRRLGPIRSEGELTAFIGMLEDVQKNVLSNLSVSYTGRTYNKEWFDALELRNIVELLLVSAKSARLRTESRGVHFREDFPHTDNDAWLCETIVSRGEDAIAFSSRPVTVPHMTPPRGKTPYLEMMKTLMEAHSDTGGKH